eukprot:jgi/Bigna1/76960/fgenesh1_pg.45_\
MIEYSGRRKCSVYCFLTENLDASSNLVSVTDFLLLLLGARSTGGSQQSSSRKLDFIFTNYTPGCSFNWIPGIDVNQHAAHSLVHSSFIIRNTAQRTANEVSQAAEWLTGREEEAFSVNFRHKKAQASSFRHICPCNLLDTAVVQKGNFTKEGMFSRSVELFYHIKKWPLCNVYVWNMIIDLHGKRGRVDHMQPLYREMLTYGIKPNVETYEIMMEHFYDARRPDAVLRVMNDMMQSHKLKPRYPTCEYALKAYYRKGDTVAVMRTFQQILDFKYRPSLSAFEMVLTTSAKNGDIKNIQRIVELMHRFEVEAKAVTFEKLFRPLMENNHVAQARGILEQMLSLGFDPSYSMFRGLLSAVSKNGYENSIPALIE